MRCWEGTLERLTLRSSETSHENGVCCTHFKSKECLEVGGNCAYGCKWEEAVWERVAAFEDTGWTPEMLRKLGENAWHLRDFAQAAENMTVGRLKELAEADKAGMNIILPCKPGDKLFVLTTDSLGGIEETKCKRIMICRASDRLYAKVVAPCVYDDWGGAHWEFTEEDFGTKVFLNQEDAEKARRKNELWSKGMSFYSER